MFTIDETVLIEILAKGESENVEFKRSPDPRSLAEVICAMLNTNGGLIFIGVSDDMKIIGVDPRAAEEKLTVALGSIKPYPQVQREIIRIGSKQIFLVRVPKSDKIHSYRNLVYIRVGASNRPLSIEELIERASESAILRFDEMPSNALLDVVDRGLVEEFLKKRETTRGIRVKGSFEDNLELLKIVVGKNNRKVLTNAGVLFFTRNPQKWIPQAKIHLVWFNDDDMTSYRDARFFEGPIWKMIDDVEEYFYGNLRRIGGDLIGWKRVEILEYPIRALREAITNAVVHRNYLDPAEIKVYILPSRIMIRNPGSFPPGVTPDKPMHKPRNPLLAQYMYDIGYIEKYGFGIKMMREECEKHPLVTLKFNIRPYVTEVIFQKTAKDKIIDEIDEKILRLIRREGAMTSGEIARELSISKPTVIKHLKKLIGIGLVKEKGRGPSKRYYPTEL